MSIPYVHDEIVHNSSAAQQVLPLLFEIFKPQSAVDIGCGLGNWLEVAKKMGVNEVAGIDGSYVDRSLLKIQPEEFIEWDLKQLVNLGRKYDLGICLEVAEHLPSSSAEILIQSLTSHAEVILF